MAQFVSVPVEDFGHKSIQTIVEYTTTLNSRRNSSLDMRSNTVKNCDFISIPYSKPLRHFRKPTLKTDNKVRSSKYDLPFRKGYQPQNNGEVFEIVAIATRKPRIYTFKDEQDEIIQGKFCRKELIKII